MAALESSSMSMSFVSNKLYHSKVTAQPGTGWPVVGELRSNPAIVSALFALGVNIENSGNGSRIMSPGAELASSLATLLASLAPKAFVPLSSSPHISLFHELVGTIGAPPAFAVVGSILPVVKPGSAESTEGAPL
jgi:hypothetical protein